MSLSLKMAALPSFQFPTIQISVTFLFSFDFDWIYNRLHGLIRACLSDSLVFNVAVPFKAKIKLLRGIKRASLKSESQS